MSANETQEKALEKILNQRIMKAGFYVTGYVSELGFTGSNKPKILLDAGLSKVAIILTGAKEFTVGQFIEDFKVKFQMKQDNGLLMFKEV